MRFSSKYITLLIVPIIIKSYNRCFQRYQIGNDVGLIKTQGFELVEIEKEQASKNIEIAPSDKNRDKNFLFHKNSEKVAIRSRALGFEAEKSVGMFWDDIDNSSMTQRKKQLNKVFAPRLGCEKWVFLFDHLKKFIGSIDIKGLQEYMAIGAYTYSAAEAFTLPQSVHPIYAAIKMKKWGEVFLGLLYNIDIINSSENGLMDLPALRQIDLDDIGLENYDTKQPEYNFLPTNILFRFDNIVGKFDLRRYKSILERFKIFDNEQTPAPEKIRALNYFQLYLFWLANMKAFFSNISIKLDFKICFTKRYSMDPFVRATCPTVVLIMLDHLEYQEFTLLRDLTHNVFDFNDEVFKMSLFKIFTMMINMKLILEKKFNFKEMIYSNYKKDNDKKYNPNLEKLKASFDAQEREAAKSDRDNAIALVGDGQGFTQSENEKKELI